MYLERNGPPSIAQLMAGYASSGHQPSFPTSPLIPKTCYSIWPGLLTVKAGVNPAAGAEVADTVPALAIWKLWAIEVVLVTDATVANRNTAFFVDDAGSPVTRRLMFTDTTNQTATQTRTHHWSPGTDTNTTASVSITDTVTVLAKFPMSLQNGVILQPNSNLRTVTTGIVGGDDYGAARYWVEEWIA